MSDDAIARLRQLRKTQKMLGTKAQKEADKHHGVAAAITAALVALGAGDDDHAHGQEQGR